MLRVSGALRVPRGNGVGGGDDGASRCSSSFSLSSSVFLPLGHRAVVFSSPSFPLMISRRHRRRHPVVHRRRRRRRRHFLKKALSILTKRKNATTHHHNHKKKRRRQRRLLVLVLKEEEEEEEEEENSLSLCLFLMPVFSPRDKTHERERYRLSTFCP